VVNEVAVVIPRWGFSEYGKVAIRVKEKSNKILGIQAEVKPNSGGSADEEVEVRVQHWQHQMEEDLSAVVGYLATALDQRSLPLHNFVMDSWINTYPADIGILNAGAIREGLPAGDIPKGAIVGMLPFSNKLVELELTGAQVIQCLQGDMIFSGMSTIGGYFHADGTEMKMDSVYTVLTTDFLYGQAANAFAGFDDTPKATELLYSQATLAYLEALQTSPENPLDQFLDSDPRK
jgi:2',3'-cyclic-nucleotide 2'-phosphodiesterase (5'-nucleotidase family)